MGVLSKWFKKNKTKDVANMNIADYINGYYPSYSQFGDDIYVSDCVQQAIFSIVNELKKLDITHLRNDLVADSDIQRVLDNPNNLMTTSDFIEKISWLLLLNSNAFIYPLYENNKLIGLYPLQPSFVDFLQDSTGRLYVKLTFSNNYEATILYEDVIHIRYKYSVSEYMGGDINGQPNNKALLETLKINDTLIKGLAKSLNMQTSINGILKIKTMINSEEQINRVKDFENKLKNNESGVLPIDIQNEYTPLQKQIQLLDSTTLEFIDKKIFRSFGVSIPIVDGNYTKEQYEAFYQKTLEPIIKSMSEAFTKGLFIKRETGFTNKIVFFAKELIFMNTSQKLELFTLLSNQGGVYVNEIRKAFGLRPIKELNGVRMMSLNYIDSNNASKYQLNNSNGGKDNG